MKIIARELLEYTEYHFRDEEIVMKEEGFPDITNHKAEHGELKTKVRELLDRVEANDNVQAAEFLRLFSYWLIKHIAMSDRAIADFLKEKRKAEQQDETPPKEKGPQDEDLGPVNRQESKRQSST